MRSVLTLTSQLCRTEVAGRTSHPSIYLCGDTRTMITSCTKQILKKSFPLHLFGKVAVEMTVEQLFSFNCPAPESS